MYNSEKNKSRQYTAVSNFVFLLQYLHFTISFLCSLSPDPSPPSNVDMAKFWDTHCFKHQYRYVHKTTLLGGRPARYVTDKNMNLWNLPYLLQQNRIFYRILSIPKYICLVIFVQDFRYFVQQLKSVGLFKYV